jgi:type II secretory pathway pseudopilin PulG
MTASSGLHQSGFSLVEALVAAVIAVIAVVGLAYSFGQGRAMIARYEIARAALAAAQDRMETLSVTPATDSTLALGPGRTPGLHGRPYIEDGKIIGTVQWTVLPYDDPSDGLGAADADAYDLKEVVVTATWPGGISPGSVTLRRLFPAN